MSTYLRHSGIQPAAGSLSHREMIAELSQGRKELRAYESMMTAYERETVREDLAARKARYRDTIVAGLLQEWDAALEAVQAAQAGVQKTYQAEAARWEAGKLTAEMTSAQQLADLAVQRGRKELPGQPGTKAILEGIYKDAENSGDLHRIRATCEVLAGMGVEAGIIPGQAAAKLRELRQPPDLAAAQAAEFEAIRAAGEIHKAMAEAGDLIGEPLNPALFEVGPLAQAARRLHVTGNGVAVLPPDHPDVLRVYGPKPDIRNPDQVDDLQG